MKNLTFAYLRVSTDKQDADNQKHGIIAYAKSRNLQPLSFVEDCASGTKDWKNRELGKLLEILKPGSVILFSEISRIGRNTLQVLEFLKAATEKEITIHIAKQNMVIDNSMNSKIVVTVLAMVSEIEREFISTRTKEALAKLKAEGKTLGRPVGSKSVNKKLQENHNQLVGYLDKKISKTAIAKIFEVSRGTLDNYINAQIL
jgi:DNA invertase Pin-like site-specific DNA recombinase